MVARAVSFGSMSSLLAWWLGGLLADQVLDNLPAAWLQGDLIVVRAALVPWDSFPRNRRRPRCIPSYLAGIPSQGLSELQRRVSRAQHPAFRIPCSAPTQKK